MKIIYGGRGSGKTTRLIEESAKDEGYIVCITKRACSRVFSQAQKLELDIPFPITYDELIKGQFYGKGIKGFHIDNVEYLLKHICRRVPLKTITFTPFGSLEKLEISKDIMDAYKLQLAGE